MVEVRVEILLFQVILSDGDKYQLIEGGGYFTIVINNPSSDDTG